MFTISVCMIVKNEETVLNRILNCIKDFADEIIIVDTGSTDKTKSIALKYTDKVFDFQWCDDFAKARNFSFNKAEKDYIMWLDADDYISKENIQKIIDLKTNENLNIDTYMFKYVMGFYENTPTFSYFRERLIKRTNRNPWFGFVHEVITPKGSIKYLEIEIEHRKENPNPSKRNLKIYNKHLRNGYKLNPREQYYYSRELYYNNYLNKAKQQLKKYLKMKDLYTPNIMGAYIILCDIYLKEKNLTKAKSIMFEYIKNNLPTPVIACKIAEIFDIENNDLQAIFWYENALLVPKQTSGFIEKDYEDFIPYLELSRLYYSFNYTEAKKYHNLAKSIKQNHPSIVYNEQFFKQ